MRVRGDVGCSLVVWEEENVLVDGHHRIAICRKHGLSYSVVYRSFPDIEAVKAWMDLNQLGRRNLSKEDRDELIRRLAASGRHTQKEIAETVGLTRSAVTKIVGEVKNSHSPTINSTSATEELEAKQREIERLRAEKDALAEKQLSAVQSDLAAEIPSAKRLLKVEGVGNPDILRVDGSCLSSRVPFTACTMIVTYHARKRNRH